MLSVKEQVLPCKDIRAIEASLDQSVAGSKHDSSQFEVGTADIRTHSYVLWSSRKKWVVLMGLGERSGLGRLDLMGI